jgi:hypothetical protein
LSGEIALENGNFTGQINFDKWLTLPYYTAFDLCRKAGTMNPRQVGGH